MVNDDKSYRHLQVGERIIKQGRYQLLAPSEDASTRSHAVIASAPLFISPSILLSLNFTFDSLISPEKQANRPHSLWLTAI